MMPIADNLSEFHSTEERDILERSTKKAKSMASHLGSVEVDMVMETPELREEGTTLASNVWSQTTATRGDGRTGEDNRPVTFKEACMGYKGLEDENLADLGYVSDDDVIAQEDEKEDCPTIALTKAEKTRLRRPWHLTLIVKVMGRKVGYTYLFRRIKTLWKPKANMEMVAIENDYFLVRFHSKDDYEFAKYEGPWMVLDHYLIVNQWMPNFDPSVDNTEKLLVWIRFPTLPIEYYDREFLMRVGEKVGTPIRVDHATGQAERGKFARMCVEVDIKKPLLAKFRLRRTVRKIEYEGLHLVCFQCGVYGHRQEACPAKTKATEQDKSTPDVDRRDAGEDDAKIADGQRSPDMDKCIRPEITENYGSWMLVQRKSRRNTKKVENKEGNKRSWYQSNQSQRDHGATSRKYVQSGAGKGIETATAWGNNMFDILGDGANPEERPAHGNYEQGNDEQAMHGTGLKGRGRRPTIQINEKYIANSEPNKPKNEQIKGSKEMKGGRSRGDLTRQNRAAAENEHILVRGTDKGRMITKETILHEKSVPKEAQGDLEMSDEHHQDPPMGFEEEDAIMDEQDYVDSEMMGITQEGCFGTIRS